MNFESAYTIGNTTVVNGGWHPPIIGRRKLQERPYWFLLPLYWGWNSGDFAELANAHRQAVDQQRASLAAARRYSGLMGA